MSMTHYKKMRNPNFLGSWNLLDKEGNFQDLTVKITKVLKEEVKDHDGKPEDVMTIHFEGHKPMICNSTNAKMIATVLESVFIEKWVGKEITLYSKKVRAFGEEHDALRVRNKKPESTKEELTPNHPKWEGALKAIKAGTAKIETIQKKYQVSDENVKLLRS